MAVDLLGDAESKFLANNLLTSEDWAQDFDDLLGFDDGLTSADLLCHLPEDLKFSLKGDGLGEYGFPEPLPEDMWMESSDSSDSGIHVKTEPMSPVPSPASDLSLPDSVTDGLDFTHHTGQIGSGLELKTEVEAPLTSCNSQSYIFNSPTFVLTPQVKVEPSLSCQPQSIHSILNSKIKIKPKPVDRTPTPPSLAAASDPGKPLVLTPEEFNQLTSQGLLRLPGSESDGTASPTSPVTGVFPSNTATPPHNALLPGSAPRFPPTTGTHQDNSSNKVLKRQQRMIKNRESASLSRKKKKEYLHTLEDKIQAFNVENQKLRQENESLKRQLGVLQLENQRLKSGCGDAPSVPPKTRTCLLALTLMLTLNLAPWSSMLAGDGRESRVPQPIVHTGRHLMSAEETPPPSRPVGDGSWWGTDRFAQDSLMKRIQRLLETEGHLPVLSNSSLPNTHPDCPTYYNTTESIRLAEKLAGWMWKHEQAQKRANHHKKERATRKKHPPLRKVKAALNGKYPAQQYSQKSSVPYQLQVFHPEDLRRDFLSAIHQRNDTFYVLSFSPDYFLLPATAYNKSTRPKMSLVMPALVNLNETLQPPEGSMGMMQIDCEVFDTRLIHVKKSSVPEYNQHYNHSRHESADHQQHN